VTSLFSILRSKREFLPDGFRDDDGVWHDGPHQAEFDEALFKLFLLLGSLSSFAIAPPYNEASVAARDSVVRRAKEAMGLE
jgi:hypothetical protein